MSAELEKLALVGRLINSYRDLYGRAQVLLESGSAKFYLSAEGRGGPPVKMELEAEEFVEIANGELRRIDRKLGAQSVYLHPPTLRVPTLRVPTLRVPTQAEPANHDGDEG